MTLGEELIKTIQIIVNRKLKNFKADRTYQSVIKQVTKKGYVVLDETGCERIVKCCIPGVELKNGDNVLIKIPNGNLKQIHIVGVNGNTSVVTTATKIGSSTVGNSKKPIYINKGVVIACDSTVGNTKKPVYMNNGEITSCDFSTITYSDTEPSDLNFGGTWIDA